jgi:MoaA/NifB/PqqE/SkfB family radical SAM enzyme
MKVYLIPVAKKCNAKCEFCITKFRKLIGNLIDERQIKSHLSDLKNIEYIEITGGGEPLLHPKIEKIISACKEIAPTRLYTNGADIFRKINLASLDQLCISRAHFSEAENYRIMGIHGDDWIFGLGIEIKLSLMLLKRGINDFGQIKKYLCWASKKKVKKVVIRQLGENKNCKYKSIYRNNFVSTSKILSNFERYKRIKNKSLNPIFVFEKVEVEIELVGCPDLGSNLILRADNKFYLSW